LWRETYSKLKRVLANLFHFHSPANRERRTLFAALNVIDGSVISQCKPRHRHQEFLAFLKHLDHNVLEDLVVHLIADNYPTWLLNFGLTDLSLNRCVMCNYKTLNHRGCL
jgi:hypothetical protein